MMNRKKDYKDLDKYKDTKRKQQNRWRQRSGCYMYDKRNFTEEEDEIIMNFKGTYRELAEQLCRSIPSVQQRRFRLRRRNNEVVSNRQ